MTCRISAKMEGSSSMVMEEETLSVMVDRNMASKYSDLSCRKYLWALNSQLPTYEEGVMIVVA